ncbi:MAG: hypothetical protein ACYDCC_02645 [Actinomycetota bacterium]
MKIILRVCSCVVAMFVVLALASPASASAKVHHLAKPHLSSHSKTSNWHRAFRHHGEGLTVEDQLAASEAFLSNTFFEDIADTIGEVFGLDLDQTVMPGFNESLWGHNDRHREGTTLYIGSGDHHGPTHHRR